MKVAAFLVALICCSPIMAQQSGRSFYLGGMGGLATLGGDGSAEVTQNGAATSLLDPKNGPAVDVFFGIHAFRYVSFQADYVWNRNDVTFVATSTGANSSSYYRLPASISQNAVLADVLVYFRSRGHRIRPYLSEGVGAVFIDTSLRSGGLVQGNPKLPPSSAHYVSPALRTAVGIDVRFCRKAFFRYSFGETLSRTTFGNQVTPALDRIPKNFQNLFGAYFTF